MRYSRRQIIHFLSTATVSSISTGLYRSVREDGNTWSLDISNYSMMLLPREHGQLTSTNNRITRRYPSRDHCMQMAAFFNQEKGILIIANDSSGGISDWLVHDKTLTINFYRNPPKVLVIPINPTLESAAKHYWAWAKDQFWVKNKSERKALKLNFISVASGSDLNIDVTHYKRIQKLLPQPIGVWFTLWRKFSFDTMYPNYSAKDTPKFRDFLTKLHDSGSIAFPYINGLLWDSNNTAFREYAKKCELTSRNIKKNVYKKHMSHLRYACPCSEIWTKTLVNARDNLVDTQNRITQGVYLDMLAASSPQFCWSEDHDHTPGDEKTWVTGIRNILESIQGYVFVEGCAEVYLDLVDLQLMHFNTLKEDSVPFWKLVYGHITQPLGWKISTNTTIDQFQHILSDADHFGVACGASPWLTGEHERELLKRGFHTAAVNAMNNQKIEIPKTGL